MIKRFVLFILFFAFVFARVASAQIDYKQSISSDLALEGTVGAGVMSFLPMSLSSGKVSYYMNFIPYGSVAVNYCFFDKFCPEFKVEESGLFNFDRNGMIADSKSVGYSSYYLKVPTMVPLPFFSYPAYIILDGKYSTLRQNFTLNYPTIVGGASYDEGAKFSAPYVEATARIYLDTPLVPNPTIFEHSYFGFYFSDLKYAATVNAGNPPYTENLIVNATSLSGGIFYDLRKETILKGLDLGIAAYVGYGDIKIDDKLEGMDVAFGNIYGLINYKILGEVGYRYVWDNNLGINVNLGVEFFGAAMLLNSSDTSKYTINNNGGLKYYLNLNFVFGD